MLTIETLILWIYGQSIIGEPNVWVYVKLIIQSSETNLHVYISLKTLDTYNTEPYFHGRLG